MGRSVVRPVFWLPRPGRHQQLCARCAVCSWSGPYSHFVSMNHPERQQNEELCRTCYEDAATQHWLLDAGWLLP
jgi:hypothetical protein